MRLAQLIAALCLFVPTQVWAAPLWQNLNKGASEAEVTLAYPNASYDQYASQNGKRLYRLEGFPAEGMWVYFIFQEGLQQVDVHGRGRANFMNVIAALTERLGAAQKESTLGGDHTSIWRKGDLTVTATYRDAERLGGGFSAEEHFTVNYQLASATDLRRGL